LSVTADGVGVVPPAGGGVRVGDPAAAAAAAVGLVAATLASGGLAAVARSQRPVRVDSRVPADVWFQPRLVLEVLSAELTLSPNHTAGWGQLKNDAGLCQEENRHVPRRNPYGQSACRR
jgi:hypothetical protein